MVVEVAPVRDRIAPNTCCPLPHPSFEAIRKEITAEVEDIAKTLERIIRRPPFPPIGHRLGIRGHNCHLFSKYFENSTSIKGKWVG